MRHNYHIPYKPPATPNWTGRSPRSSQEAFGHQWGGDEGEREARSGGAITWILIGAAITLVVLVTLAISGAVPMCTR